MSHLPLVNDVVMVLFETFSFSRTMEEPVCDVDDSFVFSLLPWNPSLPGGGMVTGLFKSSMSADDMVSLSCMLSWQHNNPIWMHFFTSSSGNEPMVVSTSSINLPCLSSLCVCNILTRLISNGDSPSVKGEKGLHLLWYLPGLEALFFDHLAAGRSSSDHL